MNASIRILLLEDNVTDAEVFELTLREAGLPCDIVRVDDELAFRNALDSDFDLIVSDYTLPTFNGKKALSIARDKRPDIPFVFVSGTIGEDAAIESLLGGASDYVLKHKFTRLAPALQRVLRESNERRARLHAEQQWQVTLAQLRNLFDNLDEVFFSFDTQTNSLLQISPACERIYGRPQESFFVTPTFWKQSTNTDDIRALQSAQHELMAGRPALCEYRIRRPDDSLRWVHAKMKPVTDSSGNVVRVDGIISDITDHRELETKFLRTQRLENLGSMAGGIAHDLNNVLSPIVMGLDLLKGRHSDSKSQDILSTMEECAKRGANLVKHILMFARGVESRRVKIDPGRVIGETANMLRQTFPKSIRIEIDVHPGIWSFSADKTQFEQVLMNLCVNARDAMPNGGLLTITARNEPAENDDSVGSGTRPQVVLEVRDTGQGITPRDLSRIFEPFFTTKQVGSGTGLGLSTVQAIVKSHGGLLKVDSRAGSGTTFRVHLPALVQGDPAAESVHVDLPSGNGETILLVDDEAAIRNLTRTILENYGYRVLVAADGRAGLTAYSESRGVIRLVLTDSDMPNMSGMDMIRGLRNINPEVRVIVTSGYAPVQSEMARAILLKPFSTPNLLKTVRDVLHAS